MSRSIDFRTFENLLKQDGSRVVRFFAVEKICFFAFNGLFSINTLCSGESKMKKFFLLAIFVLAFSKLSFAQEAQPAWQFYKSDSDEFSAEFPAQPRVSEISEQSSKKVIGNLYKAYFNKTFYFIVACQTPDCLQFEITNTLKFRARNTPNAKLSEKSLDDSTIETKFADSEGFFHVIRRIKTDKTQYLLHSVSEFENGEEAERFLRSFQLKTSIADAGKFEKEKFDSLLVSENFVIPLPQQPKTSGDSSKTEQTNSPLKTNVVIVPVKILGKPKAAYTDAARIYEISGEVYLRVVFTANKSVGAITPLKKLPFGLTDEAINAAKLINFEPALRDGKPFTIIKPVIYTFTIY